MKFATGYGGPVKEAVEHAKNAENYGFDKFGVAESPRFRDPSVLLTAVALNTRRIKIQTGILNPYTRHPAFIAVLFSSLDEIAGGRACLGLGPGGSMTLSPLGIKMWEKPLTRLRESVEVIRRLFNGENLNYTGETIEVHGVRLASVPKSRIPIYLAARGPKMLELTGEIADGALLNEPLILIREVINTIRRGTERTGRTMNDVEISAGIRIAISKDENLAKNEVKRMLAPIAGEIPEAARQKVGISSEKVEIIKDLVRKGKISEAAASIPDAVADAYGIAGTVDYCTERIADYFRAGIDEVALVGLNRAKDLELAGKEIIPRLRK